MTENVRMQGDVASLELLDRIFAMNAVDVPILIALDTESSHRGRLSELGISKFDPLFLYSKDNDSDSVNSWISTYYYAKGGSKDRVNYKPFRLGTPQPRLLNEDMENILNTHFRPSKPNGKPREVVLIGHNVTCDLFSIEECSGISLSDISNITAILDTQIIARPVLGTTRPSLKHILQYLKLDFIGLHNAGHDSRYTLRAALMLFVLYKQQSTVTHSEEGIAMARLLTEIARSHQINARRKWTTPTARESASTPDIFSQDIEDGGIMVSLTQDQKKAAETNVSHP